MDISSLRERGGSGPMTVTELNTFIKNMFDGNRLLSGVSVAGEISNFTAHKSGHLYFSVKDSEGQIKAVMFRSSAASLKFRPENGMRVILRGSVSVYVRDGGYQLYVSSMQPDGVGALYLAYEQLKEKLYNEGLFDQSHKRLIPRFPERIGVITSPTGAAVRDIINVLGRRYPLATIYLYPALVQGDGAEDTLVRGIDFFDKSHLVDTVIIGRGGGSIEDLWAFNGEKLARRIFEAKVPIISAVGHETDFTICDFVADLRAPTPSAAAELASPDGRELVMAIANTEERLDRSLIRITERMRERLARVTESRVFTDPSVMFEVYRDKVAELFDNANTSFAGIIADSRLKMAGACGRLEALNPLSVLSRGFAVAERDGKIIRQKSEVNVGDEVTLRFADGSVRSTITEINDSRK